MEKTLKSQLGITIILNFLKNSLDVIIIAIIGSSVQNTIVVIMGCRTVRLRENSVLPWSLYMTIVLIFMQDENYPNKWTALRCMPKCLFRVIAWEEYLVFRKKNKSDSDSSSGNNASEVMQECRQG